MRKLKDTLNTFKRYSKENKIMIDLEYQESFFKEKKRQELLQKERDFISGLFSTISSGCCGDAVKGKILFDNNCKTCHCKYEQKVGPVLHNISNRRTTIWIEKFIQNSAKFIKIDKDPLAIEVYKNNGSTEMTSFPNLTSEDIRAIISYLDNNAGEDCRIAQ
jgi:cytochrome c2